MVCKLCGLKKELSDSHILPKFSSNWIKETGVTGFLRNAIIPNSRRQDGPKKKLLCKDCEDLFSKLETKFSNKIFYPYVNEILDENGIPSIFPNLKYDEWLIRFILCVNWRILILYLDSNETINNPKLERYLKKHEEMIRLYLLGKRSNPGGSNSYLLFLYNISAMNGDIPESMIADVNTYLLRTNDGTVILSKNDQKFHLYSKLGPIALITAIHPRTLKGMGPLRIRKKGSVTIKQDIRNPDIGTFIFLNRPGNVLEKVVLSDKQKEKISKSVKQNSARIESSMTKVAWESRAVMEAKKKLVEQSNINKKE